MKMTKIVIGFGCVLAFTVYGYGDEEPSTSHYGHGKHHCYYHHDKTQKAYHAVHSDRKAADAAAKKACESEYGANSKECVFNDCIQK